MGGGRRRMGEGKATRGNRPSQPLKSDRSTASSLGAYSKERIIVSAVVLLLLALDRLLFRGTGGLMRAGNLKGEWAD